MTEAVLIRILELTPAIKAIGDPALVRDAVKEYIPLVLDRSVMAYEWDFATQEATTTSVADQAFYVLTGLNNDCRAVSSIYYDEKSNKLDRMSRVRYREWRKDRSAPTEPAIWIPSSRVSGSPRVELVSATGTAGKTIGYTYWRNDVSLAEWPDEFAYVLADGIKAELVPGFTGKYMASLQDMIGRYDIIGSEDNPIIQDPVILNANNRRSKKMGWGGY